MVADLLEILQGAKSELAKSMFECIDVGMIKAIIENIDGTFEKQIKGNESPFFWIKEGKNAMLDVTRKTYNDYVNVCFLLISLVGLQNVNDRNFSWW